MNKLRITLFFKKSNKKFFLQQKVIFFMELRFIFNNQIF